MTATDATHSVYEDPDIVQGYIRAHSDAQQLRSKIEQFVLTLRGKRIIDIGCGPGHDTYIFSELGCEATGMDYSSEMIKAARTLRTVSKPPTFIRGDMRQLAEMFAPGTFDGAWASASLLHIDIPDIPRVLDGIHTIVKPGGKVFIGLKAGKTGRRIVHEDKYGKPMDRVFTFWEREPFEKLLRAHCFEIDDVKDSISTSSKWLQFYLTVQK